MLHMAMLLVKSEKNHRNYVVWGCRKIFDFMKKKIFNSHFHSKIIIFGYFSEMLMVELHGQTLNGTHLKD